MSAHETFAREEPVRGSSDRTFGLVFAGFFLAVGFLPLLRGHAARWWAAPPAALFLAIALARPAVLGPMNKLWTRLGLLLQRIVSPVILGVLFYAVITPLGFLYKRILGRDLLRLRRDSRADSYWIPGSRPDPLRPTWSISSDNYRGIIASNRTSAGVVGDLRAALSR